jgi:hypothetical protein
LRAFVLGLAAALCVAPRSAAAQAAYAADTSGRAAPPSVEIHVVGEGPELDELPASIASWFRGSTSAVKVERSAVLVPDLILNPGPRAGVRIWIALESPELVRVFYVVEDSPGAPPRYLVEETLLARGLDRVEAEQLAQTAYLSATALWEGRLESARSELEAKLSAAVLMPPLPAPIDAPLVQRTEAVSSARPAPAREPPSWRRRLRLGAAYALRFRGTQGLAQGPEARAAETWRRESLELSGGLRAGLWLPEQVNADGLELSFAGSTWNGGIGAGFAFAKAAALALDLESGVDVIQRHTVRVSDGTLRADGGRVELSPNTSVTLGASVEHAGIAFLLAVRMTVQWQRFRYGIAERDGATVILTPWQVQPGLCGGAQW